MTAPLVGIIMGSKSDYDYLAPACEMLTHLGIPYEARVLSAHRTPDETTEYAASAEKRGLFCIIAAAGGSGKVGEDSAAAATSDAAHEEAAKGRTISTAAACAANATPIRRSATSSSHVSPRR